MKRLPSIILEKPSRRETVRKIIKELFLAPLKLADGIHQPDVYCTGRF